jgi:thiamine pyrophosphate-dependent acetolactate synthase large subunit-like protein
MRPVTKWAYSIPYPNKVQEAVRKAFRVALTEPQGPTHIEACSEVLLEPVKPEPIAPAAYRNTVPAVCDPAQLDAAWEMIQGAERPLFVVGRGVMKEGAVAAMQALAAAAGIPVAALQYSPDAFPTNHPLALGPLGRNAFTSANRAAPQADVIVAIGAHFDVFSTMYQYVVSSARRRRSSITPRRRGRSASCSRWPSALPVPPRASSGGSPSARAKGRHASRGWMSRKRAPISTRSSPRR